MHTLMTLLVSLILSAAAVLIIGAYKDHKEVIKLKKSKKLMEEASKLFKSGDFTGVLKILDEIEELVKHHPDLITMAQDMRLAALALKVINEQSENKD